MKTRTIIAAALALAATVSLVEAGQHSATASVGPKVSEGTSVYAKPGTALGDQSLQASVALRNTSGPKRGKSSQIAQARSQPATLRGETLDLGSSRLNGGSAFPKLGRSR